MGDAEFFGDPSGLIPGSCGAAVFENGAAPRREITLTLPSAGTALLIKLAVGL